MEYLTLDQVGHDVLIILRDAQAEACVVVADGEQKPDKIAVYCVHASSLSEARLSAIPPAKLDMKLKRARLEVDLGM